MSGTVIEVNRAEVQQRLADLLHQLDLESYGEFAARERRGELVDVEWSHVDELRGYAFLLGLEA
ncbi:hypothetical protein JOD63_000552 [Microbacterium terrae]|uniref:Uncharacterized protein n=1 Tax=Microbacterium terrae TaxID=69369 RepID=A0A0M2GW83_9MICO|nr:hypothetical protein [Microbacterium terrae]KJL37752.1 hypothetical protein RS81_03510 [Microbacterium terrae]MBP1076584.1 hypothetical protein [Microbacterium terrae]GLJ97413.1 hypothetical protein GCM10017594_06100 [Microbacterium terrae]